MAPEAEALITIEGLAAGYDGEAILENVSFSIYKGEVFVILGESGCGKSTLLKQVLGLYKPAAGSVRIKGVDIVGADEAELTRLRLNLGMLFQSGALFGSMTLFENVALALVEHTDLPVSVIKDIVKMKLALVNLAGFDNHLPAELSGGMKKRAAIARAMALDPEILFTMSPRRGWTR
ncbi:MAG: ATP-binding cassette domain-containing protein [Nitrospiraceae bacterium]|nr:ATP-binding cassette domain-containing protein [Nitrospiraceae bacterium]